MYTALRATSQTIARFLETQLQADPILGPSFGVGGMIVTLHTPQEMVDRPSEGVSIWLYRVMRDDERLNDPPIRVSPNELRPPPLPVRLHYLMTPITNPTTGNPDTEQLILGKILQIFHTTPTLRGGNLEAEFRGTDAELRLRLEPMTLEEITRVWEALEGSYQLSVSYEVSVVNIEPAVEPMRIAPVEVVMPEYGVIVESTPG